MYTRVSVWVLPCPALPRPTLPQPSWLVFALSTKLNRIGLILIPVQRNLLHVPYSSFLLKAQYIPPYIGVGSSHAMAVLVLTPEWPQVAEHSDHSVYLHPPFPGKRDIPLIRFKRWPSNFSTTLGIGLIKEHLEPATSHQGWHKIF